VVTIDPRTKAFCTCDGQCSELNTCRTSDPYFHSIASPLSISGVDGGSGGGKDSGLCSNLVAPLNKTDTTGSHVQTGEKQAFTFFLDQINCTDPDYRGIFLMVQAGLHLRSNASRTNQFCAIQPMKHVLSSTRSKSFLLP
jgi:hypothetical protein